MLLDPASLILPCTSPELLCTVFSIIKLLAVLIIIKLMYTVYVLENVSKNSS